MITRLLAAIALLAAAGVMSDAEAATITVNSLADTLGGVNCTLRNAILAANSNGAFGGCTAGSAGMDTIVFNIGFCPIAGCNIALMSSLPPPSEDVTIDGGGRPVISGEDLYRVLDLGAHIVNISNLTIKRGMTPGVTPGAAIRMTGTTLTLNNVIFSNNNAATAGGAIGVKTSGNLTLNNCTFQGNTAGHDGGAIWQDGGTVNINGGSFVGNQADDSGGAMHVEGQSLNVAGSVFTGNNSGLGGALYLGGLGVLATVEATTFTGNSAQPTLPYGGGAVFVLLATLRMNASTLSGNTSVLDGGALYISSSSVILSNVTISGNSAQGSGGGIWTDSANGSVLSVSNATITSNTADSANHDTGDGGGIFVSSGIVVLNNSIVAGNFDTPLNLGMGTHHPDCFGAIADARFNLVGQNIACGGIADGVNGNQVGTTVTPLDPLLDPAGLKNNGGPTQTIALLPCSPAIDKGKNTATDAGGQPILTDQRSTGFARTIDFPNLANAAGGDGTDIGAFEYAPKATLDIDASNAMTRYDPLTDGLLLLRYLFGFTGTPLTAGALGGTATRNADAILAYLDQNRMAFDADGSGGVDALTDGLLIARYLSGSTGQALVQGAIGSGASRTTEPQVECYLGTLVP